MDCSSDLIDQICLNVPSEDSTHFDNVKDFAVVIVGSSITSDSTQRHTGFILRDQNEELSILHLAWHNKFSKDNPPNSNYIWVECTRLTEMEKAIFADWLLTIWEENRDNIPYSVLYDGKGYIGTSGQYVRRDAGEGLTCATFVLECFRAFQFEVLMTETWEKRPEDEKWSNKIFYFLNRSGADNNHIQKQKEEAPYCVRFRPEEVVAGVFLFRNEPIHFKRAEAAGLNILQQMSQKGIL